MAEQAISLPYAEMLNVTVPFYGNFRGAPATDRFILRGGGGFRPLYLSWISLCRS
jgi:hypothetical protein